MAHNHQHGHHHHHHSHYHIHANERSTRIVVLISFCTMLLELYFGYMVNSKTLIMDGWHMLSHVLVLLLAWGAYFYILRNKSEITHAQEHKVISLSGFASAVIMLLITLGMIYESATGFFEAHAEVTNEALLVAVIAVVVNGISAFFLHREEEKADVNLRAAYLHVIADVILSIFAIISLLAIKYFDFKILDSILALFGALVILKWSIDLIRKSWVEVLGLRHKH
ncbi:MAG TPA: cation diffusion facilitator family transporter [Chitinophagales bacterium]|nr:cation diffusion facilitator family transporter [Chitinophagales bacterium]